MTVLDKKADASTPNYPIGSVDKALRLLRVLSEDRELRVSDASREIGVARSTAHRLLEMLQLHGFAQQDPLTRAYAPGPALLEIGLAALRNLDIREITRPVIEALVEEVQESAHLVILSGTEMFLIDAVESKQALRVGTRVGGRAPAYASAGGRALLAELPDDRVISMFPNEELEPVTPETLTSRTELIGELAKVRERGFAVCIAEVELDVATVGAVIPNGDRLTPAAITISIPRFRASEDDLTRLGHAAMRAARRCAGAA
ncbi:DNA-binding transcriptional regulator, IclR family [Sinosporangium album]|uniref:Glycerol operon regulatory protein n=1 Tax=Sinosporangium album TaxID=504805 RepID=A0A1G7YPQ7_9ACTN|nr:IclR family transcriptional regulator [Sinosporangium album]SDG98572.1 DNA-binding transcriptional regulator, IclR family [Sinosporangium album]